VIRASFADVKPSENSEGAGNAGRSTRRSLACKNKKHTRSSPRSHRGSPAFPAQWFTAYIALSPVIGLSCHCHRRDTSRQLDAGVEASGPHDFAVREKLRIVERAFASIASRPAFVTIASRPSWWDETARLVGVIWGKREAIFFWR
jgi:hypothetical protein